MRVSIDIPEEIYRDAEEAAALQHVSVEKVLGSAAAGHLVAWRALRAKAEKGDGEEFRKVMNQVPDIEPEEYDRL